MAQRRYAEKLEPDEGTETGNQVDRFIIFKATMKGMDLIKQSAGANFRKEEGIVFALCLVSLSERGRADPGMERHSLVIQLCKCCRSGHLPGTVPVDRGDGIFAFRNNAALFKRATG